MKFSMIQAVEVPNMCTTLKRGNGKEYPRQKGVHLGVHLQVAHLHQVGVHREGIHLGVQVIPTVVLPVLLQVVKWKLIETI